MPGPQRKTTNRGAARLRLAAATPGRGRQFSIAAKAKSVSIFGRC